MSIVRHLIDAAQGKHPLSAKRSGSWPHVRAAHLAEHPTCELCGGKEKLEVHHIRPFHLHPELETCVDNLITLCENKGNGINCHLAFGHLGSFKSFNESVIEDATVWNSKLKGRP